MRNASLDWLRVISIVYITAFWHLLNYTQVWPTYHHPVFWRITVLALSIFVLISGYLIGSSDTPKTREQILKFSYKRFIRIYPPYILALLIFAILKLSGRITLLKSAFMLGMIVIPPPATLWFIGMIVIFYVISPVIMIMSDRISFFSISIITGIAVLTLITIHFSTGLIDARLPLYLPVFVSGVLMARSNQARFSPAIVNLVLVGAVLSFFLSFRASGVPDQSFWMMPFALSGSMLIFCYVNGRLPQSKIIHKLSYSSFFLYLLHRPMYEMAARFFPVEDGAYRITVLLFLVFPLTVFLSYKAQYLYDEVARDISKRLQSHSQ